jgi:hypothetical protein
MKKIGPLITDEAYNELQEVYKSVNFGATRAVETWPILRKVVLEAMYGLFEDDEIDHLVNLRRGLKYEPYYAVLPQSWEMLLKQRPKDQLLNVKIKALENSQLLFLTDWIDCYLRVEKKDPGKIPEMRKELIKCQEEVKQR